MCPECILPICKKKLYTEGFHEQTLKDWISIAQHYGIPTKLVDLTIDPWVSIYFGLGKEHNNGLFNILYSPISKINSTFSAKIKPYYTKLGDLSDIPARNIENLTLSQISELRTDTILTSEYMKSGILKYIYKSFFDIQDEFNLLMYDKTVNLRIDRQKGLFVLFRDESKSLDLSWFEQIIVDLPDEEVSKTWAYLEKNGYTQANLLPESIDKIRVADIAREVSKTCFTDFS